MKLGTRFGLTGLRLALIDKPSPGTGATLLTEVVARIATGGESEIMSPVAHEEEARKQITATLILGRPIIILDNVGGELSTHALARALTSTTWSDRILGHSRMATLPQRAIWIATGNNLRIGGDLPRRCYRIFMDAKMSRPWEREAGEFKHPNLLEWAGENRGQLLSAALTICRNWFAAGKPKWSGRPLGTFEGWSTTVGGILEAAGIVGFLENSAEIYDQITDDGSDEWEEFLTAWLEVHGTKPLRIKDLVDSLKDNPSLLEALPVELAVAYAEGNRLLTRKFGDAFRQRDGIRYDSGLRLEKGKKDKKHKVHLWRAVSDDDPGSDCPGEGPGGRPDGPRRGRRGQRGQETPASDRRGSIVTGEYQSKLPASEVGVGDPADPAKVAPLSERVATSNVHQFRKFTLVDGETSLRRCVEHVKTTDLVAADIETTGKDWWSDTIRVVSLTTVAGKTFVVDVAKVDPAPLYRVLEKKHLVFHHAAFDVPFLRRAGCNPSRVSCTMVLSQLLHAGREGVFHSLEEVAKRYTPDVADDVKAVAVDHEVWKAKELPEDALAYAASDTQSLLEVYRAELDALVEEGLGDVAELEERFLSVVVEVVDAGMPVDPERWSAVVDEVVERKLALSRQLDAMLGDVEVPEKFEKANRDKTAVDRINWSSPEQKVWAVEEALGLTVPTRWDYKKKVERKTLERTTCTSSTTRSPKRSGSIRL